MRPFNLEKAKAGNPVQNINGTPVRIVSTKGTRKNYPILGVVSLPDGEAVQSYTPSGQFINGQCSNEDLFMTPETHSLWFWVNKYGQTLSTKEKPLNDYPSLHKFTWEE